MIRFESDYLEGALPEIMEALVRTNLEQTPGYGEDAHCENAARLIREKCAAPEAAVHFLVGGTQANLTVIAAALRPHQAVMAADTGHIAVHETGSIEATGHKVITLPSPDGKIRAEQIRERVEAHWADATHEHQPQPAMVYISQPTENGTVYSLAELEKISAVCREKGLILFVDGARLGAALACSDVTLADLARLTDVFYIGGTKLGALFGEAVVITNPALGRDFRYVIKQRGGMFAKGRLLGVMFETLMSDGLYERTGAREVSLAMKLRAAFAEKGWPLMYDSPTNQQFPIVPDAALEKLAEKYSFSDWARTDEAHRAVRFCTSWATRPEDVDELTADIARL
ncbi:MAG TPA: aminotransferase class I/II-fold pyridoxal phosphate-dependent enzyme [Candidatus Scatomorpha pullistercoris]|uniref:Aminotransferase class I/II-fold pyridoxal phosphate-dependent enzyme n=1 Tax=Candidatus Scatomorpha pullistercoris TaxID=2840929 RepID=A0A9D1G501_9FIRM|nr:aminotransferase class I/II-fold pyridoxal phosphate-dependent enzyme [Candidatus Scatomorpha pullistercoris]